MPLDRFAGRVGTRPGALDGRVVAPFERVSHADRLAGAPLRHAPPNPALRHVWQRDAGDLAEALNERAAELEAALAELARQVRELRFDAAALAETVAQGGTPS
jgi:predicted TIM-barrel fold metal-dependent hydrolase